MITQPVLGNALFASDVDKYVTDLEQTVARNYDAFKLGNSRHNEEIRKLMEGN